MSKVIDAIQAITDKLWNEGFIGKWTAEKKDEKAIITIEIENYKEHTHHLVQKEGE